MQIKKQCIFICKMIAWLGSRSSQLQVKGSTLDLLCPTIGVLFVAGVFYFLITDGNDGDELSF